VCGVRPASAGKLNKFCGNLLCVGGCEGEGEEGGRAMRRGRKCCRPS